MLRAAIEKDPRRYYAYVNLADLLAEDPARWERRDAIVAFLDKGLEALKDDRKGRFNLLLGLAGFERAVGRTAAARARLQPLLVPEAPPLTRAQRKRVLDLLDAIALDERAQALEDWPAPRRRRPDRAGGDAASPPSRSGAAGADRLRATRRGRRAIRAEALEALGRVDEAVRDLEIAVNLAPSNAGPGARSAACSPRTAARWSSIAPTRRCARRSRWSRPGPTCASCAPRSPAAAPPS